MILLCKTDFLTAFQMIFAIATILVLPFLPESPRWLYSKNRTEEADIVMSALKGLPVEHEVVQAERGEILAAIALEDHFGEYNLKTIFYDKSGQRISYRMALVFIIQMIQQLPGVNIVIYVCSLFADDPAVLDAGFLSTPSILVQANGDSSIPAPFLCN